MTGYKDSWTPERRAAARERMLKNKPWEKSTGPKTYVGKAKSSMNASKEGLRSTDMTAIKRYLRLTRQALEALNGGPLR